MVRKLIAAINRMLRRVRGLTKWIDDPYTNGKIRRPPIRGPQQPIASTGSSVWLIPAWRSAKGTKDFVLDEVAGRASTAIDMVVGTGRDYGRGGYDYTGALKRWMGRQARRAGRGAAKYSKKGGKAAAQGMKKGAKGAYKRLKK